MGYVGGKDRDPTGGIGSDKPKSAGKGKESTSGTAGALSASYQGPGSAKAADKKFKAEGGSVQNGRVVRAGGADSKPAPEPKNLPPGVSTQYTPGAVAYYGDSSWGQVIGTVAPTLVPGGGLLNNAPSIVKGKFDTQNTGGLLGEGIDSLTGQKPGVQTGWAEDPSMSSTRGRSQRGTKRESFDQTAIGSTGDATSDPLLSAASIPTADFSDVSLADRRKPGLKQMLETML
jgi:hypothetical protein